MENYRCAQRSSQSGFFLLRGKKKRKRVKLWSVRKEHLYFISCAPYSKWNWLDSGTHPIIKPTGESSYIQFPCSLHIINERKKDSFVLYVEFHNSAGKITPIVFGMCWRLDLTPHVFLTFTLQSPWRQCLFGLYECSLVYSVTFHNLFKNNPS